MRTNKWASKERRRPAGHGKDEAAFERTFWNALPKDKRDLPLDISRGEADASAACSHGVSHGICGVSDTDSDDDPRDLEACAERVRKRPPRRDLLYLGHDGMGAEVLVMLSGEHRGQGWHQAGSDARMDEGSEG